MQRKNIWFTALVMVLVIALLPYNSVYAAKVKVKSVKVQAPYTKTIEVAKKKSVKIVPVVTATPNKNANKKVSFKSKNKKIATVNAKGVVKGKKPGKTKIIVTSKKNKKKKATISVVVKKNPIQKVSLDKTSVTLEPNAATLLKATITAKSGSSKKIYWTSSNDSVATVSQSGSVVAKKAGTATITAKAIDGSKKSASCVVTVKQKEVVKPVQPVKPTVVNLHSVAVNNYQMLTFTLDNPCKLTKSQIMIQVKAKKEDTYEKKISVSNLTTTDNKTYKIEILGKESLPIDGYVLLSIPSLSGTKKDMEVPVGDFTPAQIYSNSLVSLHLGNTLNYNITGMMSIGERYTVEGLLPGLKVENRDGYLYLTGEPTQVGASVVKVDVKKNNRLTKSFTIPVAVYDSTHMVACPMDIYVEEKDGDSPYIERWIAFAGGKGPFTYSIIGETYGLRIVDGALEGELTTPGDYSLVVEIKDSSNPSLVCRVNVKIHYTKCVSYILNVNDANGNPLHNGVEVTLLNQDYDGRAGVCSVYVTDGMAYDDVPAGTYDIYVQSEYGDSIYKVYDNVVINESKFLGTVKTPLYRVDMAACNGQADLRGVYWYDNDSKIVGVGQVLYLENGTYDIHTAKNNNKIISSLKKLTAKFTVKGQPLFINATMSDLEDAAQVLDLGLGVTPISLAKGEYVICKFMPEETSKYKVTTDSSSYLNLSITDEYFTQEQTSTYFSSTSSETVTLTKGKTYYFKVKYTYTSSNGDFNLTLQKTN